MLTDVDPSLYVHTIDASFAAVAVRSRSVSPLTEGLVQIYLGVFAIRRQLSNEDVALVSSIDYVPSTRLPDPTTFESQSLVPIVANIKSCRTRIGHIIEQNKLPNLEEKQRTQSLMHTLRVFEVEILCLQKDWPSLRQTVEVSRTAKRTCSQQHLISDRRRFVPIHSL